MFRLTRKGTSTTASGWHAPEVFEGRTAGEVLDQWQDSTLWSSSTRDDFRRAIVENTGAKVQLPAPAEEVLRAVVRAAPEWLKLEDKKVHSLLEDASRRPPGRR